MNRNSGFEAVIFKNGNGIRECSATNRSIVSVFERIEVENRNR